MEEKPLLQFYTDETWGYDIWDEERKSKEGIGVKFQQIEGETREAFFRRLGFQPIVKMYGSVLTADKMARSEDWEVRCDVADCGYDLDILVNDEHLRVREAVARRGYGLDILVYDENPIVRKAVAEKCYGLDILVHDEYYEVRQSVAKQGLCLGAFVHDEHLRVREEVARQGFGLDILINDRAFDVRSEAEVYLMEKGYPSIEAWIEENPKKCADRKNRR